MQTVLQLHSQKWLTSIGIRHRISVEHSVTSSRFCLFLSLSLSLFLSLSQRILDVRTNVRCYNVVEKYNDLWFIFLKKTPSKKIFHTIEAIENNTGCACERRIQLHFFFWYFDLCVDRMPNKSSKWRLNSWKYLDLNLCKCKMCLLNWANNQLNELSSERFLIDERES